MKNQFPKIIPIWIRTDSIITSPELFPILNIEKPIKPLYKYQKTFAYRMDNLTVEDLKPLVGKEIILLMYNIEKFTVAVLPVYNLNFNKLHNDHRRDLIYESISKRFYKPYTVKIPEI